MKIKMLTSAACDGHAEVVPQGAEVEVEESFAKGLIASGYAEEIAEKPKKGDK